MPWKHSQAITKPGGLGTVSKGHLTIQPRGVVAVDVLESKETNWYLINQTDKVWYGMGWVGRDVINQPIHFNVNTFLPKGHLGMVIGKKSNLKPPIM